MNCDDTGPVEVAGRKLVARRREHRRWRITEHGNREDHDAAGCHVGGTLNSTVNPDYAGFFQTLPPEALETAIRMEADRMKALTFDEA